MTLDKGTQKGVDYPTKISSSTGANKLSLQGKEKKRMKKISKQYAHIYVLEWLTLATILVLCTCCGQITQGKPAPPPAQHALFLASATGIHALDNSSGRQLWQIPNSNTAQFSSFGRLCFDPSSSTLLWASDFLYSVNSTTGRVRWKQPLGSAALALSYDKRQVYVATAHDTLAFQLSSGNVIWRNRETQLQQIGTTTLQLSTQGTLIIAASLRIQALDASSGRQLWDYELPTSSDEVKDTIIAGATLVVRTQLGIFALSTQTSKVLWHADSLQSIALDVTHNTLYLELTQPSSTERFPAGIEALDLTSEKQIWQAPYPLSVDDLGMIDSSGIYSVQNSLDKTLTAFDLDNGNTRWSKQTTAPISQMLEDDNTLYAQTSVGEVDAYTTSQGHLLWTTGVEPTASLLVLDNCLYLQDQQTGTLNALSASSGRTQWTYTPGTPFSITE